MVEDGGDRNNELRRRNLAGFLFAPAECREPETPVRLDLATPSGITDSAIQLNLDCSIIHRISQFPFRPTMWIKRKLDRMRRRADIRRRREQGACGAFSPIDKIQVLVELMFAVWFIGAVCSMPYHVWEYANHHGFWDWLFLGTIKSAMKSMAWPFRIF